MSNELHAALMDLIGTFNRPQPDAHLLRRAGVNLERALFPLLVRIGAQGPIGVVELAEVAGRDHSTVSRQVAKLESLGLVERRPGTADQRVREAVVSPAGRQMVDEISRARAVLMDEALADWSEAEKRELTRLVRKLADTAKAFEKTPAAPAQPSASSE